jgi:hypothetical protein
LSLAMTPLPSSFPPSFPSSLLPSLPPSLLISLPPCPQLDSSYFPPPLPVPRFLFPHVQRWPIYKNQTAEAGVIDDGVLVVYFVRRGRRR